MDNNLDKDNLKQVLLDFPKQFLEGLELVRTSSLESRISKAILLGMGGSALRETL